MSNLTARLDFRKNTVFYPLEEGQLDLAVKAESSGGLETRLAQRGLIIGLQMEDNHLKLTLMGNLSQKSSGLFKEFVSSALNRGFTSLILDLANLKTVDGAGLAALVWVRDQLEEHNGQLIVSNLSRTVRTTLLAANFQYLVNISDYDYH